MKKFTGLFGKSSKESIITRYKELPPDISFEALYGKYEEAREAVSQLETMLSNSITAINHVRKKAKSTVDKVVSVAEESINECVETSKVIIDKAIDTVETSTSGLNTLENTYDKVVRTAIDKVKTIGENMDTSLEESFEDSEYTYWYISFVSFDNIRGFDVYKTKESFPDVLEIQQTVIDNHNMLNEDAIINITELSRISTSAYNDFMTKYRE